MLANSKGQKLSHHLLSVAHLSKNVGNLFNIGNSFIEDLSSVLFLSGLFHDLGKVDPNFQIYMNKKNDEVNDDGVHQDASVLDKRATHNELSWAILNSAKIKVFGRDFSDIDKKGFVKYSVLWHHKKLKRSSDVNSFDTDGGIFNSVYQDWDKLNLNLKNLVDTLNAEYKFLFNDELGLEIILPDKDSRLNYKIPAFKETTRDFSEYNGRATFVRSILISSDRHVSQMDGEGIGLIIKNKYLYKLVDGYSISGKENDLTSTILTGVNNKDKFPESERSISQDKTAELLAGKQFSVLAGPPGCGKTRIALLKSSKEKAKKIFWICPRLNICESVFNELYKDYTPDLNIELFTGESKTIKKKDSVLRDTLPEEELSSDVVVTTIDQILSILTKNGKNKNLPKILDSHFIFDEYHEIFQIPDMIFLFKELLFLTTSVGTNVLLMSATPNPSFLKKIKSDFIEQRDIVKASDFHDQDILVSIKEEFNRLEEPSVIDIYNIVSHAQDDYTLDSENSLLFHSSFTKEDKKEIFNELFESFGKNGIYGNKKNKRSFHNLRAGPIVQASLNISAKKVRTDKASPDNLCQRLGRCDRFGIGGGEFEIINKVDGSSTAYLSRVEYSTNSSKEFILFLKKNGFDSPKKVKRQEFIDLYYQFHEQHKSQFDKDWERIEKDSMEFLKEFEEVKFIKGSKSKKIISSSFRGESVYVLPLVIHDDNYLYNILDQEINLNKTLTISSNNLELDEIIKNFSSFCRSTWAKHKYDMNFNKYNSKAEIIKRIARDPKFPIFTSFSSEDCNKGGVFNNDESLVYVPFSKVKKYFGLTKLSKINKRQKE